MHYVGVQAVTLYICTVLSGQYIYATYVAQLRLLKTKQLNKSGPRTFETPCTCTCKKKIVMLY